MQYEKVLLTALLAALASSPAVMAAPMSDNASSQKRGVDKRDDST